MIYRLTYIIPVIMCLSLFSCKKTDVNPIIHATVSEFIPDKRVAFCNVQSSYADGQLILTGDTNISSAKDSVLARVRRAVDVAVVDSIEILPKSDFNIGIVTISVANIRSMSKHSAELSTQALLGTQLTVFKKVGTWYYVQTPDQYLGWIDENSIKLMDHLAFQNWDIIPKIIFTSDVGLAYDAPSLSADRVSDLVLGNILLFKGQKSGFIKVGYPDGRSGYVPSGDAIHLDTWIQNIEANPENIIDMAKRFMGRPYLWGGTSSLGFDCSGLTKTVYGLHGYMLPRDASQQVLVGTPIDTDSSLKNLKKGDLLFFGRKATASQNEKVTHVAIYINDGKIIHSTGDVKIESLKKGDADFNQNRYDTFIKARRILGSSEVARSIN